MAALPTRERRATASMVKPAQPSSPNTSMEVTTLVLVPEAVEAIRPIREVPVLAAGGIATGRQMAAAIASPRSPTTTSPPPNASPPPLADRPAHRTPSPDLSPSPLRGWVTPDLPVGDQEASSGSVIQAENSGSPDQGDPAPVATATTA
jgi:hypothetical protein